MVWSEFDDACIGYGIEVTTPGLLFHTPGYARDGSGKYFNGLTCYWNFTLAFGEVSSNAVIISVYT